MIEAPALRRYASLALVVAVGSSIYFGVRVGQSPMMKLGLILLGLAVWYGLLTWLREVVAK